MSNVSSGQTIIINQAKSNGLGTAGFVVSLIGFLTCGLISPLGLLFSFFGLFKAPRGLAIAGTVLGLIGSWWMIFFGFAMVSGFSGVFAGAKIKAAKAQLNAFEAGLDIYQLDIGTYPTNQQGLQSLLVAPADLPDPAKWQRPYLKKGIPLDPWGNAYRYELTSPNVYRVWSAGPDGISETKDDVITVSDSEPASIEPAKPIELEKEKPATSDSPATDEKPAEPINEQPAPEEEPTATMPPEQAEPREPEWPREVPQPPTGSHSDYRTWTDASGRFSVEARYVKNVMGTITLEKRDGTTVDLTLEKLSDADREFIKNRKRAGEN